MLPDGDAADIVVDDRMSWTKKRLSHKKLSKNDIDQKKTILSFVQIFILFRKLKLTKTQCF